MASITSVVKAADFILSRPTLSKVVLPLAKTFSAYAGYRQMGLKFDDLIIEETPIAQTALNRIPEEEKYARVYRQLTAHQLALSHELLPKNKAVQPNQDNHYLIPYLLEAEKEAFERAELDNLQPEK